MRAAVLVGHGGPEQLELRDDVPVPSPGPGEVLVRVSAAAVNNTDLNTRVGWYEGGGWTGSFRFPRIQGIDACGVAGHSLGGALTLQFAADQPRRVKAFAAINPVVTGRVILRAFERLPLRDRWMAWSQEMSQSVLGPLLAGRALDPLREWVWPVQRRIEDFNSASSPTLLHTWNLLTDFDIRPRLAAVTVPGLIVLGDRDINVPNSDGLSAVAALPNARLVFFRGGHTLTDTYPVIIARLLRDFFAPPLLAAGAQTP